MSRQILVPIDGSPQADEALEFALTEYDDPEITALHVIDPIDAGYSAPVGMPTVGEEWYENMEDEADELFAEAQEVADEHGVALATELEVGRPSRAIVEYADDHDIDHIVMGSHGRSGVTRILIGSVAESVVRRSSVPVTVVR